ncbi:MAG: DNA polymerase III subunit alpha [Magnetococcales bacterium]|nr:DNA polymerase III subunit alpha [Magnetococcales bacterium]
MSYANFVHLHVHSGFSLLTSSARVEALIQRAKALRMPALALTDHGNLFAAIPFFTGCLKAGIKPILGAQLYLVADRHDRCSRPDQEVRDQLILLCRNQTGWQNLMRLVSAGHLEGSHEKPRIDFELLQQHHQGLIALSAAHKGAVGRLLHAGEWEAATAAATALADLFREQDGSGEPVPGFFIELQRHGLPAEEEVNAAAIRLAHQCNIPLLASNDIHMVRAEEHRAQDALLCVGLGHTLFESNRPRFSERHCFSTPEEMASRFADLPEALANTLYVAQRCNLQLELGKTVLPDYRPPQGEDLDSCLRRESEEGLQRRLQEFVLPDCLASEQEATRMLYQERLAYELEVILQMGFSGYFLIVSDFIRWAKREGIPVGPGRGSGAGSLVAWSLDITDLDPIRYQLLFERFLNPERVSMPDFDVDFCMDNRERVIHYVRDKYGADRVAQIITFGTLQARVVIRDVGRVLEFPYGRVDRIAKLIPMTLGITLKEAIAQEEPLRRLLEEEEDVQDLINLAMVLEGLPRSAGTHAAGVVMANGPLTDMVPLYRDPRSEMPVTQFNMGDVEKAGLVKFDFLGLKTLTVIADVLRLVNQGRVARGEPLIDINRIDLADDDTFALLKEGQTRGVFQLESSGMRDILRKLAPDTFEEVVALVALYRPGPLGSGMVDDFINRKHGRIEVSYPLPMLEPILKETFGVILYQEQVMKIAQVLAGYTLGGADLLRRAMGKKKMQEMLAQRAIFMNGALANNIPAERAGFVFDLMEKFAGYGFNKSHSAAYALISYQTAWLKAHYPVEFMAATLTCDLLNSDKVAIFVHECRAMQIAILPPDVNVSVSGFAVERQGEAQRLAIRYGLAAIKNVGEGAVEGLLKAREQGGPFASLFELCRRIRGLNRRMMEQLIKSGACDCLGQNRATLLHHLPAAMSRGSKKQESVALGFRDLFADTEEELPPGLPEFDPQQKLLYEKEALGFYVTGHPMDQYHEELQRYGLKTIAEVKLFGSYNSAVEEPLAVFGREGRRGGGDELFARVAGMLSARKLHRTKKGDRMAFLTLEDADAQIEITVFADVYQASSTLLEEAAAGMGGDGSLAVGGRVLIVAGKMDRGEEEVKLLADEIMELDRWRQQQCRVLHLKSDLLLLTDAVMTRLSGVLAEHRGELCRVVMEVAQPESVATLRFGHAFSVTPSQALLEGVKAILGPHSAFFAV